MAGCFSLPLFSSQRRRRQQSNAAIPVRDTRPWLMLNHCGNESELSIIRPIEGQCISLPLLPKKRDKVWCIGCKDGWVVAVHNLKITLLNPVTGAQVSLPKFYNMLGVDASAIPCVTKVVLSDTPTTARKGVITAMAITRDGNLAYAKSTDRRWTTIPVAADNTVRDIVYHSGLFCILCSGPDMMEYDEDGGSSRYRMSKLTMLGFDSSGYSTFQYEYIDRLEDGCVSLVSSPGGELLLVLGVQDPVSKEFVEINVMVFQPTQGTKWAEVEDLGDHCLFLDAVQSTLLPVTDAAGLRGNCAYIANFYASSANELVMTTGEFDRATGRIEPCFPSFLGLEHLSVNENIPFWFKPSSLS